MTSLPPSNTSIPAAANDTARFLDDLVGGLDAWVCELRMLQVEGNKKRTARGYFDNKEDLLAAIDQWKDGRHAGIYLTLQEVDRALLARCANRVEDWANSATSNDNVVALRHLLIDVDPKRASGVSATDQEKACAKSLATEVAAWLADRWGASPTLVDTGNGVQMLYKIGPLENNAANSALLGDCLETLAQRFDTDHAVIDTSVAKAAQLVRVPGTWNRKGDSIDARPHRPARLLHVAGSPTRATLPQLAELAKEAKKARKASRAGQAARGSLDLGGWLQEHNVATASNKPWKDGTIYRFDCPFAEEHTNDAYVTQFGNGALAAGCHHDSCDWDWKQLRQHFEPNPELPSHHSLPSQPSATASKRRKKPKPPKPLGPAAYHGLIGEIVRALEDGTEADPAAILMQLLVAFGNMLNASPHFLVENARHTGNEFLLVVGDTSRARKGSAWNCVRRVLNVADRQWLDTRIQRGLSSGEGLISAIRDPETQEKPGETEDPKDRKFIVKDEGVSDKRLLVVETEFSSVQKVAKRDGNTLSSILRCAWDGTNLQTMTRSPLRCTDPHVSIIGHITKNEFKTLNQTTDIFNGLINRFMFCSASRQRLLPFGGTHDDGFFEKWRTPFTKALACGRKAAAIALTQAARDYWAKLYIDLEQPQPGQLDPVTARGSAHVRRLAMLYTISDCRTAVDVADLEAAAEVWRYSVDSAAYVFGESTRSKTGNKILTALKNAGDSGLTRTEISVAVLKAHTSQAALDHALDQLEEAGLAKLEREATAGRTADRWFYSGEES